MSKIKEIILEPQKIFVGSTFKLKIKAIRYMTCEEMKNKLCSQAEAWTCREVNGK